MAKRRLKTKKMSLKEAMEPSFEDKVLDNLDNILNENEVRDYIGYIDDLDDDLDDTLYKDDPYKKYEHCDDDNDSQKLTKNLARIKETELKKEKTTSRAKKQRKLANKFNDETVQVLRDHLRQIIHLEANLIKKEKEITVLKGKNKKLEIENQELKDNYNRFDILDFGDRK